MKTWLEHMNWSFLDDEVAERLWDEARRRYFDDDTPLNMAFKLALEGEGFKVKSL